MKLYEPFSLIAIAAVVAIAGGLGIWSIYKMGAGNPVEKVAEVVVEDAIESETGVPVDIDPEVKELEKFLAPKPGVPSTKV